VGGLLKKDKLDGPGLNNRSLFPPTRSVHRHPRL
jgi:hypothetical protein